MKKRMYITNIADRIFKRIEKRDSGCWLWTGNKWLNGYGKVQGPNKQNNKPERYAHRAMWMLTNGNIPEGKNVLHICDVRECVNPEHLYLGNQADNVRDMFARGRACVGEQRPEAKLTEKDVLEIRASNEPNNFLAKKFNTSTQNIWQIKRRLRWKHI